MNLSTFFTNVGKTVKQHSPEILTALGVSGVISTSYLTAKASFEAKDKLQMAPRNMSVKNQAKIVWKCYIPPGISGAITIGCIIAASKTSSRRTTAAVAAYSLTERAFSEYKEKVVEQIGETKERKIRDELAQQQVTTGPPSKEVIVLGKGNVLCCELYTHRYFRSDMETLRKAQNDINQKIIGERYVTLDDFYEIIGIAYTCVSNSLGWDSDKLLELEFTTTMSEDNEPCLAFRYNYVKPL